MKKYCYRGHNCWWQTTKIWQNEGLESTTIKWCWAGGFQWRSFTSQHCAHAQSTYAYVSIPYVKNTSESIRRILTQLGKRTSFQPTNAQRQVLVRPKDPMPKENRSGVIDQIACSRCPQTYIGQTGRSLRQRLKEHQQAVRDRNTSASALVVHVCSTGHPVDCWKLPPHIQAVPTRVTDDSEATLNPEQRT